jgi:ribonucleoside-triphosphate reductase
MDNLDNYRLYIHKSRYARFLDEKGRRENWDETVQRLVDFYCKKFPEFAPVLNNGIRDSILTMNVMPSMRSLMTAGPALEKDNICGYNCSYIAVDNMKCFSEALYILMNGTGLGFSVERQFVNQLPTVSESFYPSDSVIQVRDSKLGWAQGLQELISLLYQGLIPKWDVSKLRPAGARLKTFGGRSSGPAPLVDLFQFCVSTFKKAAGRKLNSLECHDIMCKVGEIVVVGGVRRSALISLSNLSDDRMRAAKNGQWWEEHGLRALANNSAAYTEKPEIGIFMKEWLSLYESKSGERGIFNRVSAVKQSKATGRRDTEGYEYGTNPCGEIILRPNEFCNLSEVIVRVDDTLDTLKEKVKQATILGTFQASLTDFKYIRSIWKKNCEEERLLGVSLTGIMDHVVMAGKGEPGQLEDWCLQLKQVAIDTNKEWAGKLGIPVSAAITTIKPSGTVSQLVDSASGIHPRYAHYYIRTVRQDKKDPLGQFLKDAGVPCEDDVTKPESTWVFSFPQKAPRTAVFRDDMSAIQQLDHYLAYKKNWCEHNPSITVYVRENEWLEVGNWVYKNFDDIGGVSFLPHSDHSYRQAPYQEIDVVEYNTMLEKMPDINWESFIEITDNVEGAQTLACSAAGCEIL